MKKTALLLPLLLLVLTFAQGSVKPYIVQGTVKDALSGKDLSGVRVMIRDQSQQTTTGADGRYSLQTTLDQGILVFSKKGYFSQTLAFKSGKAVHARLRRLEDGQAVAVEESMNLQIRGMATAGAMHSRAYAVPRNWNTEAYAAKEENGFRSVLNNPLSTFSADVDAASYSNIRRFINQGKLPPQDAVRIEEMINYFEYNYPEPSGDDPVSINTELSVAPWNPQHRLVRIGLQGKKVNTASLPASNLVFLIDVSGSMFSPNKLPLVKSSLKMLTDQLRSKDRVAIVTYAGRTSLVLASTPGNRKQLIKDAIDALEAGGSTAGAAAIQMAYEQAARNFIKGGNNRIIMATDGDFNVGVSSDAEMQRLVEEKRKTGVFLSILGYGMGNLKDSKLETMADKGNGNYGYIDNINEARRLLVSEFGGTLFTIAKDVKLQVEFNPAYVQAYRLIGYENRMLNKEDFNNDKKDAGDMGAGHRVTALYELIPTGVQSPFIQKVDKLRYQAEASALVKSPATELLTVKMRYKQPDKDVSKLLSKPVMTDSYRSIEKAGEDFRFAAAVAQFGMLLSKSEFSQGSSFQKASALAQGALGRDPQGYRAEFLRLVKAAALIKADDEPIEE